MPVRTYELRDYETKRPLSAHSSEEGAMLGAMFHVRAGQSVVWLESHGTVEGRVRFEIAEIQHRENPNQKFR